MIAAREHPQPPGTAALWADAWYVDFAGADGFGGFVRLAFYPNLGVAWWWTCLVRPHGPLVAVRDHEVPLPRNPPDSLEVRADGLWAELVCETPLDHWSIGLEAFGLAFDDPAEAWRSEWGDRLAVGLDLEWEALGPPLSGAAPGPPAEGYVQPGRVVGTVLLADERIDVDVAGLRARSWGVSDWWSGAFSPWAASLGAPGRCVLFGGEDQLVEMEADRDGIPERAAYRLGGERWEATVLGAAPVLVTGPKGSTRLARALCRFTGPGEEGVGWAEWRLRS